MVDLTAQIILEADEITPEHTWGVERGCLDYSSADDLCLTSSFVAPIRFTVGDADISPAIPISLLGFVESLTFGIEQLYRYSGGARGCVITPICEYELEHDDFTEESELLHIYYMPWDSEYEPGQHLTSETVTVVKSIVFDVFRSFIGRTFQRVKSFDKKLSSNSALIAMEQKSVLATKRLRT